MGEFVGGRATQRELWRSWCGRRRGAAPRRACSSSPTPSTPSCPSPPRRARTQARARVRNAIADSHARARHTNTHTHTRCQLPRAPSPPCVRARARLGVRIARASVDSWSGGPAGRVARRRGASRSGRALACLRLRVHANPCARARANTYTRACTRAHTRIYARPPARRRCSRRRGPTTRPGCWGSRPSTGCGPGPSSPPPPAWTRRRQPPAGEAGQEKDREWGRIE